MAYSKKYMIERCLKAIKDEELIFFTEIPAYVPFSLPALYTNKIEKIEDIKKAIEENRIIKKKGLQKKWYDNNIPATQLALYKLLATEIEYERINTTKLDHTTKGDKIQRLEINVTKENDIQKYKEHLKKLGQLN